MQKLPLKILRDYQDSADPSCIDLALRAGEIWQLLCDCYIRRGVDPAREVLAALRAVAINDGDGNVPQRLIQIGLRVENCIESDTEDQYRESRFYLEDTAKLPSKHLKNAVHECASPRRRGAPGLLIRSRDVRMLSSLHATSPARATVKASRTSTDFQERSIGVPLTVWSTRAVRYHVPGSSAPQPQENAFMPRRGNPIPMKPNAGAVTRVPMLTALTVGFKTSASKPPRSWQDRMNSRPAIISSQLRPRNGSPNATNNSVSDRPSTSMNRIV